MRYIFKLPDVGEGTAEAEIVAWHVGVGDDVAEDQHLVDVMTDKATVEITAPVAGTVVALMGKPGEMATVGAALVEFETAAAGATAEPEQMVERRAGQTAEPPREASGPAPRPSTKILAAPAVRQRAIQLGIALDSVHGSGPDGRVTHADLDRLLIAGTRAGEAAPQAFEAVPMTGLRRRIAERMEAALRVPHFAYVEEIDMTALEELRARLNGERRDGRPNLTILPFLMQALVRVLPDFLQINAHFDGETGTIKRYRPVHIGIATETAAGLMVPVVKHAERLDLWQMAEEVARLAERARTAKASKDELTGSTITVSSLGARGGIVTTPIINLPEVAIIAPNAIRPRPVVKDGKITICRMMNLSSCYDHRVVDGAGAAQFVERLKTLLERPDVFAD